MRSIFLSLLCLSSVAALAEKEYPASKVKLLKHFDLVALSAKSGNTCWGYVSKSGHEYALMGCSNKTAIVDVADPVNAKIVATIPHSEGLWSDIKVYKDACYVSSETSGTGLQVIDLSKIDEGKATLVKTIPNPGRSHTIAVDEAGGFLYTCGSNEGVPKGASTCFSLKNPLDPQRTGVESMTPVYQHESQVVTYASGKYKGRTIFFGGGEGRGLEIWDVTDKDKPFLVRRVAYPFVGYCHQGWLSADRKFFYVNDEFDEATNSIATRTLVFDVSDIDKADLVSTYSTGRSSIDHNLYTRNNFVFHANYTTGLWIFNANDNPLSPKLCGFFDTFPANDKPEFSGAWSNYPLLPSGIVLISDINDGLFIVDATEATKTAVHATVFKTEGAKGTMSAAALAENDSDTASVSGKGKGTLNFEGTCKWAEPSKLSFELAGKSDKGSIEGTIELYNFKTKAFEAAMPFTLGSDSKAVSAPVKKANNYVDGATKQVRARVTLNKSGSWAATLDQAGWSANP